MKRVAFIAANESGSWGGSEFLWSGAAERLARSGVEVRVSAADFRGRINGLERVRAAGGLVFPRRRASFVAAKFRRALPVGDHQHAHLRAVMRGADLVVISQGSIFDGLSSIETVRAAGFKYAIILQGACPVWWPADDIAERLRSVFDGAAGSYFVSEATRDICRRQLGTCTSRTHVVRNPFNVSYDAHVPWPEEPPDRLLLAAVGRLEVATKGQDLVLEVLALPRWRQRQIRTTLVGGGPHERALQRIACSLDPSVVSFAGHQENIESVWHAHHALILPSRTEGMPLALVEAMLCGRPAIVTDVGGNCELVRDGVNGFVAKAPTVEFLDEAMERAWQHRHRLREMGEAAARDVRAWVGPDPVGDFVRELEGLVAGQDARRTPEVSVPR